MTDEENDNMKGQLIAIKAMAGLLLQRCSELEKWLDETASDPAAPKGDEKSKLDPVLAAKVLSKRRELILRKTKSAS